jgi:hypothetical protein
MFDFFKHAASIFAASLILFAPSKLFAVQGLYLSEVSANYATIERFKGKQLGGGLVNTGWVELFNNSTQPINLKQFKLRSAALERASIFNDPYLSSQPEIFSLPDIEIKPRSYVVITGRIIDDLCPKDIPNDTDNCGTDQIIYIKLGDYVPYWGDKSGFVELLNASNDTVDFVRFGNEGTNPLTPTRWGGENVKEFTPDDDEWFGSRSPDPLDSYSRSIVRLSSNFLTNGNKDDWTEVQFPTPGGPNDVPAGAVDSDNDGIPDLAKDQGKTFAGLNLYDMGARRGQRDLFIHVDYMNSTDLGIIPQKDALQKVVQAFAPHHKIRVHFDVGNRFSDGSFNLSGNVAHVQTFTSCTQLGLPGNYWQVQSGCKNLYSYPGKSLDVRRRPIFRYMLLANSQDPTKPSSSGYAELPGNKFEVTLGGWGFSNSNPASNHKLINQQASTIMHELGHTLGLRHGGDDHYNYKPNYFSVMNYMYQLPGLPSDATGSGPTQRFYYYQNRKLSKPVPGPSPAMNIIPPGHYDVSTLLESPYSPDFRMDYSDGSGRDMSEGHICENQNIGRNRCDTGLNCDVINPACNDGFRRLEPQREA